MSESALIVRDDAKLSVSYTAEAQKLKEVALASAAMVGKVTNAEENAAAVAAQVEIQRVRAMAEKARTAVKAPVLDYGRRIDAAAKEFLAELDEEMLRVSKLVADFQQLEQQRARAAEQLRQAELAKIEREKLEALTKAKSHDQIDAIQAHYNEVAAQSCVTAPIPPPVRADGQSVRTDWEITITNPYDLAKFHPSCVNISPRLAEIKALLNEGVTVRGIKAEKVTKAGVRIGRTPAAIEV